jgi:hypothetical protein
MGPWTIHARLCVLQQPHCAILQATAQTSTELNRNPATTKVNLLQRF